MARVTLGEIADLLQVTFTGDRDFEVASVRTLIDAGPDDLSFIGGAKYRAQADTTRAGALIVPEALEGDSAKWIRVKDPYFALARVLQRWFAQIPRPEGVSPAASIDASAVIGSDCRIGAFVSIGRDVVIGDRVTLFPGVVIGDGVRIGNDTTIHANAAINYGSIVGERCILHANTVLGGDGFGFAFAEGRHNKISQIGIVRIGNDVELGAGSTVDRAALGETVIGDGTKIDNLVQVAHNVRIGKHCILVAQVGVAGSAELGDYVIVAGQTGIAGHIKIGSGVQIAAKSVVTKSWDGPAKIGGNPARPLREANKTEALVRRLGDLFERVGELERLVIAVATKEED